MTEAEVRINFLRHTLATVAYRGGKTLRGAPAGFSTFSARPGSRPAGEILAHVCDLFDWACHLAAGQHVYKEVPPGTWEADTARFHASLARLDALLASDVSLHVSAERLFQGPIADALTHIGQIAILRRLAGSGVRGENYSVAKIAVGQVGADQPAPVREFD